MEKKSLNKKLQLNKETIAILDKEQQSQILGGEAPKTRDDFCGGGTTTVVAPESINASCAITHDGCQTISPCFSQDVNCGTINTCPPLTKGTCNTVGGLSICLC